MALHAAVYVSAALLGALLGGAISLIVSTRSARRERRARYGESLLNALTAAERRLASGAEPQQHGPVLIEPVLLREQAVAVWSLTELASTLESPTGRESMRAWGLQLFDALVHGVSNDAQMMWLFDRLDLAVFLTSAWTVGNAPAATSLALAPRSQACSAPLCEGNTHPITVNVQRNREVQSNGSTPGSPSAPAM
ncbi:MAG: hypothetical protein J2O47_01770 [Acidimicrobiaceae bacterium]|nr:hypothetical protein [Acidimicrobiaceae bacterium]